MIFACSYDKIRSIAERLQVPELTLESGNIYCIIGSNGSGKSTFAKILAGVLNADNSISLFSSQSSASSAGSTSFSVGYMPQKNYGFRMRTMKNIILGNPDKEKAASLMEKLHISHLASKRADRLSGGETARMALARLMMKQYHLVILDEPTAAMDMETTFLSEWLMKFCTSTKAISVNPALQIFCCIIRKKRNTAVSGFLRSLTDLILPVIAAFRTSKSDILTKGFST